ncbi:YkyB family protein [Sediminibacillus massiliensis]|uniref:YkyB family protein n=1 Tax=Sediminibacillus massiliensis TaxID=1926277 RepID=UPI0009884A97|nr:YkyB family protein [Sediminibacillus massiliensis]
MVSNQDSINLIAKALYTVNRHAKSAPDPRQLYAMKKQAINKLIKEKQAKKVGLHFSENPRFSRQYSTLLVKVSDYYFHIPPTKSDFKELKHLGNVDKDYRNPKPNISLAQSKKILSKYLGWSNNASNNDWNRSRPSSSYYTPSSLGQWNRRQNHK